MSYLVDALKKAERERHENQRADLRSLAGGEPSTSHTGRALRWLVGVLVACNAALLVYLFLPAAVSATLVEPAPTTRSTAAPVAAVETANSDGAAVEAHADDSLDEQRSPIPPERPATVNRPAAKARPAQEAGPSTSADNAPRDTTTETSSSMTLPPPRTPAVEQDIDVSTFDTGRNESARARGQVTYSATPLDDDAPYVVEESRSAAVSASPPGSAPDVEINGHLYSSVPGRSFILVRGQRYHEGERLAAGPAVESIDASGATLNYRGERYHVRGPG